jgi:hypothetical protein
MQFSHSTSAGFFRYAVFIDKYLQQTMHSPHCRFATSEKYMSESGADCISKHSLDGTDMEKMGKYQQQFQAGLLISPEEREMADAVNLTSEHENVIHFLHSQ